MKRATFLLAAIFLLAISPCPANADVSVTLRLDRSEATLMDSITMLVKLSGVRKSDSKPILNGLESFDVTRTGTSSRVEIINGKINSGIDYTYVIQPKKTGTFKIGPAEVKIKGKTFRSNTETLKIMEPARSSGANRGSLFLGAALSSRKIYVEEEAIYSLKLYCQKRVGDLSLNLPETENLTFKQLGKPSEYQGVYNGESYKILEVRYALTASEEGIYAIRPSRMNMTVFESRRRSPRSLFDDPFFSMSSRRPMTLDSEPLELEVVPLPDKGRPAGFSGLVGTFEIESRLEPSRIKAGESATLTVFLKGRGNTKRMPDLKMPDLDQIKVYEDQPVLEEKTDSKGLTGVKTMKWALVPETEGKYRVPPMAVSFFDTGRHEYRTIKTRPHSLTVLPGEAVQFQASAGHEKEPAHEGTAKKAVKEIGHDILPVHASIKDLAIGSRERPGDLVFWVVLLLPLFVYGGTLCGLKIGRKSTASMTAAKAKKAAKDFIRQCRQGDLRSNDLISFITDYFNDRFGLALGSLTPDEAAGILESNGVSTETSGKMRHVMQALEDAIYTGKGHANCEIGQDIPKLIRQVEKEIR
ncbi:MAG: protein BatD [Deltaproteobacteria bacterium]|nr:protein BatD [Deltaproteobacteria bacterium]MBW2118568.1 protein BatD [Deltaproteobacteria bacterium]